MRVARDASFDAYTFTDTVTVFFHRTGIKD